MAVDQSFRLNYFKTNFLHFFFKTFGKRSRQFKKCTLIYGWKNKQDDKIDVIFSGFDKLQCIILQSF